MYSVKSHCVVFLDSRTVKFSLPENTFSVTVTQTFQEFNFVAGALWEAVGVELTVFPLTLVAGFAIRAISFLLSARLSQRTSRDPLVPTLTHQPHRIITILPSASEEAQAAPHVGPSECD